MGASWAALPWQIGSARKCGRIWTPGPNGFTRVLQETSVLRVLTNPNIGRRVLFGTFAILLLMLPVIDILPVCLY